MNISFEAQGVSLCGLTHFLVIYDYPVLAETTAAVNNDVLNMLAEKIDPSILEAANQAANTFSDVALNTSRIG